MSSRPPLNQLSVAAQEAVAREQELDAIFARWDAGERADARAALRDAPHLASYRSAVVSLAYEEYCQREEGGETVEIEPFIAQFVPYDTALRKVLALHHLELEAKRLPEELKPGDLFSNFEIVDRLGQGAFSNVYLAADTTLSGRPIVLKLTNLPGREPEALGKLQCPYVVPALSAVETDPRGPMAIVMPFYGQATFDDLLARLRDSTEPRGSLILDVAAYPSALPPLVPPLKMPARYASRPFVEGAVWLLCGIAEGLSKAHQAGFAHLDLKPSNILLADGGCPMLADFNLSQHGDDPVSSVGGTVPYMAPEHLRRFIGREGADVTKTADVFSFGVIAHQLLAGSHPHGPIDAKLSPYQLAKDLLERLESALPPSLSAPGVNHSLRQLIVECLQADPQARPSAEDVRRRLSRELETFPSTARIVARNPRRSLAGLGMLFAAIIAGGIFIGRLPTALERNYAAALDALHRSDVAAAAELVKAIRQSHPDHTGAKVLEAQIAIEQGNYKEAVRLLEPLIATIPDPELKSCYAYACLHTDRRSVAIQVLQSLQAQGYRTPADLNNFAYALIREREFAASRAVLEDPLLLGVRVPAVLFNRANLELTTAQRSPTYDPTTGLIDALEAERIQGPRGETSFLIAHLRVIVAKFKPDEAKHVIEDLRRAVRHGFPKPTILNDPRFQQFFGSRPEFQELSQEVGDPGFHLAEKLIRPLFTVPVER